MTVDLFVANDISKSSYGIIRVRSTFAGAYEVLTSRLYIRASEIVSRRSGRPRDSGIGKGNDGQMSILIGIMGVTDDVSVSTSFLITFER